MKRTRISIAIGSAGVLGTLERGGHVHSAAVPLAQPPVPAARQQAAGSDSAATETNGGGDVERAHQLAAAIERVCHELAALAAVDVRGADAHVVLLPPLAENRLLRLPPLRAAEIEAVARREAGRHFVSIAAPRLVGVLPPPRRTAAPVMVAAVSAAFVEAIRTAVLRSGLRLRSVASAHGGWLERARTVAGAASAPQAVGAIVAVIDDTAHIVRVEAGAPTLLRRVPAAAAAEAADAAGEPRGAALVLADTTSRQPLEHALAAVGWPVQTATDTAEEAAARHAAGARLRFRAASAEQERRAGERRLARGLAAAAVVLVLAAATLDYWSAGRALERARADRLAIRDEVEPLLALRDSLGSLQHAAARIDSIAAHSPRWTAALFDIALLLPPETHLTRLHATGDTLVVEAAGARAGGALQALRSATTLRDARLLGVVDRELADGTTSVERFRIRARLAPAATPAPAAGPGPSTSRASTDTPAPPRDGSGGS